MRCRVELLGVNLAVSPNGHFVEAADEPIRPATRTSERVSGSRRCARTISSTRSGLRKDRRRRLAHQSRGEASDANALSIETSCIGARINSLPLSRSPGPSSSRTSRDRVVTSGGSHGTGQHAQVLAGSRQSTPHSVSARVCLAAISRFSVVTCASPCSRGTVVTATSTKTTFSPASRRRRPQSAARARLGRVQRRSG